ncbi:MAG: hypothetical protein HYZ45_06315, partial [Burkholderiales bacterium]|nr:hypothetical protein [Burkholderiales bacterium]
MSPPKKSKKPPEISPLEQIHRHLRRKIPPTLAHWPEQAQSWVEDYYANAVEAQIFEVMLPPAVFLFDSICDRVMLAYGIATPALMKRDNSRIRGYANVNATVQAALGERAFVADKGHFLGHASGGQLEINLFAQRRELNRGWSSEGKRFREMERYVADHPGTFFYHRPLYE